VGKWIPLWCTVGDKLFTVMDVLNLNYVINHCIRNTILSEDQPILLTIFDDIIVIKVIHFTIIVMHENIAL